MNMTDKPIKALILAGRRNKEGDPLDPYGGGHKAFIEIGGKLMIERVLDALGGVSSIKQIAVAAPDDVRARLSRLPAGEGLDFTAAEGSPAKTVAAALDALPDDEALLVTTCDHALLTDEMIRSFLSTIDPSCHDVAAACVEREIYEAAYPETRRTFIRFSDFAFSGANLFWFNGARAKPLVEFWQRLEGKRKKPAAMAVEIGVLTAFRYLTGQLTKAGALNRIMQKTGVDVTLVSLPFAEAAIDIDKLEDIETVRSILAG